MFRRAALRGDLDRFCDRLQGGRARRWIKVLATPGTQAVIIYRFGGWQMRLPPLLRWPLEPLYRLAYLLMQCLWGIQLPRTAKIGPGLIIGHFGGIVVSGKAVMGTNCTLMHGVTIGQAGDGAYGGVPEMGNDVFVGPGAKLFGKIRIGHNVKIGANAVIHQDVADNAVVALAPGFQIISFRGNRRHFPPKAAA
jgi:serine O-acetyltransferase